MTDLSKMTTASKQITTDIYRLTPTAYFRMAAGAILPAMLSSALLAILLCATLAVLFDLRIIFVGLIIIFLIIPFAVGHIYYSRLLTVEAQRALSPKCVVINKDSFLKEVFVSSDEENTPPLPVTHQWNEISGVRLTSTYIIVTLSNKTEAHLAIPLDAFPGGTAEARHLFSNHL